MAEVTNELIYEILKKIQEQIAHFQEGQRVIRDELTALRGHQLAMQKDIYNIHERLDVMERKIDRIEHRLELRDEKV